MKRVSKLIILILVLICSIGKTLAYYNTSDSMISTFNTQKYSLNLHGNGGVFENSKVTIKNNNTILPNPTRKGYQFSGFSTNQDGNVNYSTTIGNVNDVNNKNLYANWQVLNYSISYDLGGGTIVPQPATYNVENTFTLATPTRTGFTFGGWTGTDLTTPTKLVIISNSIGNRSYTATWIKNYYTVNYYVNSSLWTQRSVGYNDSLENLNAQSSLDIYHTFHGWNGWVNNMPNYDINLYANITESYCRLVTGHGAYGNASALLNVFRQAGWSGTIIEAPSAPKNYMVVTDYNLTRAQAENQKNYIASHTNYKNYNYPFLYWVAVECTNGYAEAWTRGLGQSTFS